MCLATCHWVCDYSNLQANCLETRSSYDYEHGILYCYYYFKPVGLNIEVIIIIKT